MKEKILELFNRKDYVPKTVEELSAILEVDIDQLKNTLSEMEKEYLIKQTKKKKYDLLKKFNLYVGVIDIKDKGFGFIRCEDFTEDFYVPKELVAGSMDNDKVLFSITNNDDTIGRKEAAVIDVIERSLKHVIGKITLSRKGKKRFEPNDKKLADITFEVLDFGISVVGDIVDFIIEDYINAAFVSGRINYVIGNINDVGIDVKTVAYKYGFHQEFDDAVINEVKNLNIDIDKELERRQVFSGNIITIDGEDAKDLDDAISIKKLDNGNYELGVYIADVSYYVTEGSKLDHSAFDRGTSVYLADRVIPMLPHKLSNDLCSLNENENKLVMVCLMEINQYGQVVNHEITEGVIKTKHRMTYTDVNAMLEAKDQDIINKYQDIYPDLLLMEELALVLRIMRTKRGALDFDIPEAKIIVNELGKPLDVVLRTRGTGEKLIEEFMLIANETVAQTIENLNLPFIYRIHDEPNALKLQKVSNIARALGYKVKIKKNKVTPQAIQSLLNAITEEDKGLSTLLLRMMAKAKYSEKNIGHYGLASSCYTHFTSPIRRYPDLIVHRYLRKYLFKGEVSIQDQDEALRKIIAAANQSSKKERDAIDCEYEVTDMKKAEYMEEHIGEQFMATITSVTNFGIFASLDNTIEGLIHISDLDGYYVYNENQMALIGPINMYRMGDKVLVEVVKASKELRQIDFKIVRGEGSGKRNKSHRQKQKGKS
jgi:ribonuclease R